MSVFTILTCLYSCTHPSSSPKKSKKEMIRIVPIRRRSHEKSDRIIPDLPVLAHLPRYPWESLEEESIIPVTRAWFRCKGIGSLPPIFIKGHGRYHRDCDGLHTHSLPIKNYREFIYPTLIELLNHVQKKTQKKVVVTCGHRCPRHNLYADPDPSAQTSKHQIGAEVDFYVEGMEYSPEKIVNVLIGYYQTDTNSSSATHSSLSWANKEVKITIHREGQGRDQDNQHPYPYLTIELLYDKQSRRPVRYASQEANSLYRYAYE